MGILSRGVRFFKENTFLATMRKIVYLLGAAISTLLHCFRKIRFFIYTNCWVDTIRGKVHISGIGNRVHIGSHTTLYEDTVFEINEKSSLKIGDYFTLSYGSLICCQQAVVIGNYVMIGEYSSIRDTTHVYDDPGIPYCLQTDKSAEISIGNNVWIGRGCIIMPGTTIQDGVIVAANSVVKGELEKNCMYGGTPASLIKRLKN
jgi:acetyltransferase-like isoleucine patch superfamily enzyme